MTETPQKTQRIGYLDAARGIAACMVMVYHYTGWKYPDNLWVKLSHIVFNGSDAVSFFFVLSGFVLSFPYIHYNKPLDVGKFYINRIYRIYPAFIIALVINVLFSIRNDLKTTPLDALWNTFGFHGYKFWEELILIRGRSSYLGLDWTLTIEIVMSFFIPYLIAMVFQNRKLIIWLTLSTFLMGFMIGVFVLPFVLGMLISVYFTELQSPAFKNTKWHRYRKLFLILAIILFSIRHLDRIFPFGESVMYWLNLLQLDFFSCTSIASFIFLVFIIQSKSTQRILEHPVLMFLGKVSYGIYLLHWVIVAMIFENWDRIVSYFPNVKSAYIIMLCVCSAITILLSAALYYWIELPFIKKGKKITKRWKASLVITK